MHPYRRQRIASDIREVVSNAIAHKLNDPRVDTMTTVTRVVVSGDVLVAKVFLSVRGGQPAESRTLAALRHAGGYVQRLVARKLSLRQCPQLRFEIDDAFKDVRRTMELMSENRDDDVLAGGEAIDDGLPETDGQASDAGPQPPGRTAD